MTRADGEVTKVHYRGQEDDFVVMIEGPEAVKRWKADKSVPLVDVVNSFDIFVTHKYCHHYLAQVVFSSSNGCYFRHGAQGQLDRASASLLENEFGTKNTDEVVRKILEQGEVRESKVSRPALSFGRCGADTTLQSKAKEGDRNPNNGPGVGNFRN